jgi:NAD(P)-dependent dehydrogenase (short-subunit alcohol dehydrogenase family)
MSLSRWAKLGLVTAGVAALGLGVAALRRQRAIPLARKTILITGGARGLGLILARKMGLAGARIAICSRNAEQLERARLDLLSQNIEVWAGVCDVTDRAAVQQMISQIQARWGQIDIVVNNAGVIQMGPLDSLTPADFEVAMQTHFWGPLNVMLEVLPSMRARRSGRIVNIASIGGKVSVPHLLPYCSSKFALVGLSEGLAASLAQEGVHVTTVCPGLMRTGSPRNALFKGQNRAEYAWFSIFGSLPGFSMSGEGAADQIIDAARHGDASAIVGIPAKVINFLHTAFPEMVIQGMGLANRFLPGIGGIGRLAARGAASQSSLSPSFLTQLTENAAVRNNET